MADKPDVGRMSDGDNLAPQVARPLGRSGVEDITKQTSEVFQKEDNLWYFIVRDAAGNVVKEWTQGMPTEEAAVNVGKFMFADITTSTNRTRQYKTRPQ